MRLGWGFVVSPDGAASAGRRTDRASLLLVDDHALVREGLRALLEAVYPCAVTEATSASEGLRLAGDRRFDVALVDVCRPEDDGLWLLRQLRERVPGLPVIMLSTYDLDGLVASALEAGASGFLLKDATASQLREALETAHRRRGIYLHPLVARRLVRRSRQQPITHLLSAREIEIIGLLAGGSSSTEVAAALYLTPATVKAQVGAIVEKLGAANPTQAVAKALAHGLVPIAPPVST